MLAHLDGEVTEIDLEREMLRPLDAQTLAQRDTILQSGEHDAPMLRFACAFAAADEIVVAAPYMISLILSFAVLIAGYLIYGRVVEGVFAPDERKTPAYTRNDGVDFLPMPTWKAFLVQLLNIAGTGPIFGALMGACFGPVVFLWIIFGAVLILMALGILGGTILGGYTVPEITLRDLHPAGLPIWPFMFVTVACGAISGFHATQSPMVAKCITSEKLGRKIFYGAMLSESVIALVWAARWLLWASSPAPLPPEIRPSAPHG